MKDIIILGSTGSIGTQALQVIRENKDKFNVLALTCGSNVQLFRQQIVEFKPKLCGCKLEKDAINLSKEFSEVEFFFGEEGIAQIADTKCDVVLNSLMGMRGLVPTYKAILRGNDIALANKETLVAGGSVIMEAIKKHGVAMLPVDSEHSAIFQCLEGNKNRKIQKILLTASGGPFRGWDLNQLERVTTEMALKHPNWNMGRKITIDSATMMNKGLEIIEAKWLFDVSIDRIEVLIHPQSIVHSGVEFVDNSVITQMGTPDMKIPISLALGYPDRIENNDLPLNFFTRGKELNFFEPELENLPCLKTAIEVGKAGGTYPVVMNGANEVLVQAFLDKKIGFLDIPRIIQKLVDAHINISNPSLEEILEVDKKAREDVLKIIC